MPEETNPIETPGDPETFRTPRGEDLAYVAWRGGAPSGGNVIVYLHGIERHAAWFAKPAAALARAGYDVYCLDRRGSGLNRENRGFPSGHVDRYETLLDDIDAFLETLEGRYGRRFLAGLSWGGKLALAHGLRRPRYWHGLVLITPGLRARVDLSTRHKLQVLLNARRRPTTPVPIPIEPEMFTRIPEHLDCIRRDPLRLHHASARCVIESLRLDRHLRRQLPRNELPILVFLAGHDRIIDNPGVIELLKKGKQQVLDILEYHDQTHSIPLDAPDRLVADLLEWLRRREAAEAGAA